MTGAALAPAGRRRRACSSRPLQRSGRSENLRLAQRRTSARTAVELAAGSAVSPVWTGEGCTIVLAGAVSQWKRSDGSSAAIGPPVGVAGRDALERLAAAARTSSGVAAGRQRGQRGLVELGARAEEARAGGRTAPRRR